MARIMVMEDDPVQAGLLADELTAMRHEVEVAYSATEALKRMEDDQFDLLVTDIFVQRGGGYVPDGGILLIGRIRSAGRLNPKSWLAKLPILAISGVTMEASRVPTLSIAESVGATRSMAKPLSFEALRDAVDELLDAAA
ncbi:MAG: response regulator [Pseudomonadota bacterium]